MNRGFRGILLDFYGTVVEEDDPTIGAIVRKIHVEHPVRSEAFLKQEWGSAFVELVARSFGLSFRTQRDLAVDSLAAVLREIGSVLDPVALATDQFAYWQAPSVRPGAAEFVTACPVPICVVSNIDRADLDAALRHTGLPVTLTVTSEDVRSYKPRHELFEAGLGLLGLEPHEVLHIGDSLGSDIAGANALGIPVAWVNSQSREAPQNAVLAAECCDLRDLLPLIQAGLPRDSVSPVAGTPLLMSHGYDDQTPAGDEVHDPVGEPGDTV